MKFATRRTVLSSLVCGAMLASLSLVAPLAHASKDHPEIGFCIDDLRVERWSRDATEEIAEELDRRISTEGREVSGALQEFVESNIGRKMGAQLDLPLRLWGRHG